MSSRYNDNDGDMVADIPADKSQWVDPDTLIFAYTPVEDPAVYADVWADFLDHLADATGKKVQFFPVQSNAAQQEALRAGRLHVAGFNTGGVPVAVNCGGFRPFTIMAAVANSVLNRMLARDVVEPSDYESIFTSETFPTTAYGTAHNLTPELQEQIQDAFFSYDWEGTALEAEFANSGEAQFIPITYQKHWNVIRTIADVNGVTYDCD